MASLARSSGSTEWISMTRSDLYSVRLLTWFAFVVNVQTVSILVDTERDLDGIMGEMDDCTVKRLWQLVDEWDGVNKKITTMTKYRHAAASQPRT